MTLYDLTEEGAALQAVLDEFADADHEATAAEEDALLDWLHSHEADLQQKAEAYCRVIADRLLYIEGRKAEEQRLATLRRADAAQIARMKGALLAYLQQTGQQKIETPNFKVRRQANGGKPPLILATAYADRPEALPERFRRVTVSIDANALRDALLDGDEEAGDYADLGDRGEHIRVS